MKMPMPPISFDALDACHQQTLVHLHALAELIAHVQAHGFDAHARKEAKAVETFFSHTSRKHHADEERSVFPPLLDSPDPMLVQAVRTLQQDHGWIEENWIILSPQLSAIAEGSSWLDADEFQHTAAVFLALCTEHIELEESLIYPEAKKHWQETLAARALKDPSALRQ